MNITNLEKAMILAIPESEYADNFDHSEPCRFDCNVWTWSVVETAQDKGVISSLVKKDIVTVSGDGNDSAILFTEMGMELWNKFYNETDSSKTRPEYTEGSKMNYVRELLVWLTDNKVVFKRGELSELICTETGLGKNTVSSYLHTHLKEVYQAYKTAVE
ncbi:hypothetical protein VPHD479_0331 [Vibrio phage D479]